MRIWRTSPALFMLLLATFGLFIAHTLGHQGKAGSRPVAYDQGTSTTVTVFTEVSSDPGAPAMEQGGLMLCVAILCGLIAFALATMVVRRCRREPPSRHDSPGGSASVPRGPPLRAFGLTVADLSVLLI